jgi:hypothetical protein
LLILDSDRHNRIVSFRHLHSNVRDSDNGIHYENDSKVYPST